MSLTTDQSNALDLVLSTPHRGEKGTATTCLVTGSAGTGKTYLASEVIRSILAGEDHTGEPVGPSETVVLLAPTHKALGVLRRNLDEQRIPHRDLSKTSLGFARSGCLYVGTVSAWLGKIPVIVETETGDEAEIKFKSVGMPSRDKIVGHVGRFTLVVDECSMLERVTYNEIVDDSKAHRYRCVFFGDAAQLNPVAAEPVPWHKHPRSYTLEEIVRQRSGSDIVDLATRVRKGLRVSVSEYESRENSDIRFHRSAADFSDEFVEHAKSNAGQKEERDRSVVLAFRNRTVDAWNDTLCREVYGHGREEFRAGEVVILNAPLFETNEYNRPECVATTSEIVEVEQWDGVEHVVPFDTVDWSIFNNATDDPIELHPLDYQIKGYRVLLRTNVGHELYRWVLGGPDERAKLDSLLGDMRKIIRAPEVQRSTRSYMWRQFFIAQDETFASIAHFFALTVHKSQGSTFKRAGVIWKDLGGSEARSLKYVAATRPAEELVILR